uniref:Uncharacterized protein n=1 Tax=Oryza glumipatula TaxID=40148 RepID=A0A0D9YD65_9ORYZ
MASRGEKNAAPSCAPLRRRASRWPALTKPERNEKNSPQGIVVVVVVVSSHHFRWAGRLEEEIKLSQINQCRAVINEDTEHHESWAPCE